MTEQINPLYVCTLWYKPRKTMQGLIENGRGHRTALIVAIASGMIQAVPVYSSDESLGVSVFLIGAIIGFLGLYLLAWLLRNFGRWFGAQASLREVRTGLGLGLMPWLLCFSVLFLFRQNFGSSAVGQYFWLFFIPLVYGYIVVILSLTAVLRLTPLKTFLCLVLTIIFSLFPLTLLFQVLAPLLLSAQ
jgi:hypothetical protein